LKALKTGTRIVPYSAALISSRVSASSGTVSRRVSDFSEPTTEPSDWHADEPKMDNRMDNVGHDSAA